MEKLSWKAPTLEDLDKIRLAAEINNQIGNEMSAVNLFLYQIKYDTKIAFFDDMLFRQYKINNQKYFGLSLVLDSDICKSQKAKEAKILQGIDILRAENQETGKSLSFFYVYQDDLEFLKSTFQAKIQISLDEANADYIYLRENLGILPGSKYHKKRNHISKFLRTYPMATFTPLSKENLRDAFLVEKLWFEAAKSEETTDNSFESIEKEFAIIKNALENFEKLNLFGGLVYIDKKPVAMTVASSITSKIMDIHFEKALMPYAFDGAYSFINNQFAKTQDCLLFNREEDLGLPGLKKAKLSYYPTEILQKWSVKIDF